jgi:hypothetical protein
VPSSILKVVFVAWEETLWIWPTKEIWACKQRSQVRILGAHLGDFNAVDLEICVGVG